MIPRFTLLSLTILVVLSAVTPAVSAAPADCTSLRESKSPSKYQQCLRDNTSKQDVLRIIHTPPKDLTQKQIDAVYAIYPRHSDGYGFNKSQEQKIVEWMTWEKTGVKPEWATATTGRSDASNAASAGKTMAESSRVVAVPLNPDFVSANRGENASEWHTTGPFAFWTVSERVEQAEVVEPKAEARVLEGSRTVHVSYADDAAPVGEESLYTLKLYFADGSTKTLRLYASKTDVDVGSQNLRKYRSTITLMLTHAKDNGYERSAEGVLQYYKDTKEQADLLDHLFSKQAKKLIGNVLGIIKNPLGIAASLALAALFIVYLIRNHEETLKIMSNDSGKANRLRRQLMQDYREQAQEAAEEELTSVLGDMSAMYWKDAYGVKTTYELADLARKGPAIERDGEVKHAGGVTDLTADEVGDSWLEAVTRTGRLPSERVALVQLRQAVNRMCSTYSMAHIYDDTEQALTELIDEMDVTEHTQFAATYDPETAAVGTGDV